MKTPQTQLGELTPPIDNGINLAWLVALVKDMSSLFEKDIDLLK